jgi:hypothetical protein
LQQSFLFVDFKLMQQGLTAGDACGEQQSPTVSLPRQDTAVFDSSVKRLQQSFLFVDFELMQQDLTAGDACGEQQPPTVLLPR